RIWFHTQDREQAIKFYVKARHRPAPAVDGTVAELVDRYIRDELPRRIRLGKLKQITADEYTRQAPRLKDLFGDKTYALNPAESGRHDVLRRADVVTHLRRFEGLRGAVSANRLIALLSIV